MFTGEFGPFEAFGPLNIHGSVVDHAGNWTPFVHNITVEACIE
jgi:hypothetical protein